MAAVVTVQAPVTLSLQGLIEGEREISSAPGVAWIVTKISGAARSENFPRTVGCDSPFTLQSPKVRSSKTFTIYCGSFNKWQVTRRDIRFTSSRGPVARA
jgi:hypothetical protein